MSKSVRGFTLMEILVALTLGLFLTLGMVQAYLGVKRLNRSQESLVRMVENAQVAIELLAREMRMARYWGCIGEDPLEQVNNLHTYAGQTLARKQLQGIHGTEGSGGDPDTVRILRSLPGSVRPPVNLTADYSLDTLATLPLPAGHGLAAGDMVALTDCEKARIFHLADDGAGGLKPGCTGCEVTYLFEANTSQLWSIGHTEYYIASNAFGEPSLYRREYRGVTAGSAQELVEGVESMQIEYGKDTDDDGVANLYYTADAMDSRCQSEAEPDCWLEVVSARVEFTLRSLEDNVAISGGDGRLRHTFEATYALLNQRQ